MLPVPASFVSSTHPKPDPGNLVRVQPLRLLALFVLSLAVLAPTPARAARKAAPELLLKSGKTVKGELRSSPAGITVVRRGKETLHAWADVDWVIHRRKQFVFHSRVRPEATVMYVEAFEQFMAALPRTFGFKAPVRRNAIPQIRMYRSRPAYKAYTVELCDGDYSDTELGYFKMTSSGPQVVVLDEPRLPEETLDTLLHEGTHLLLHLWGAAKEFDLPVWIDEGMAEYFGGSSYRPGEGRSRGEFTTGAIKAGRLLEIREQMDKNATASIDRFIRFTYDSFNVSHYGQAWSLVHYLAHHDDGRRAKLVQKYCQDLMRTVRTGDRAVALFRKTFRTTPAKMEKEWKAYVDGLEPSTTAERLALAEGYAREGAAERARKLLEPLAEDETVRCDVLVIRALALESEDEDEKALSTVDQALVARPDDPKAVRAKAYISRRARQWKNAIAAYQSHLVNEPFDLEAVIRLMECLLQAPAPTGDPEEAIRVGEVSRAYHENAELIATIARAHAMVGRHDRAVELLEKALALEPKNEDIQKALGEARKAAGGR